MRISRRPVPGVERSRTLHILLCGLSVAILPALFAAEPAAPSSKADRYAEIIRADEPVAWWRLRDEQPGEILNAATTGDDAATLTGRVEGKVTLQVPGPLTADFPLFGEGSRAVRFHGDGGSIRVADPGENSVLDFAHGDSITLEAWVRLNKLGNGQQVYLVGKGRTQNPGAAHNNQNYALRLQGNGGSGRISFLFRNSDNRRGKSEDFHRWNSDAGIPAGGGWHHIAVTYTFGEPESIRGYVDGRATKGKWDFGGATDKGPVVDDDEVWIGSSMGAAKGSTLNGDLAEVAIYRRALSAERIAARYQPSPPPPPVADAELPPGAVLVEILEGIPDVKAWGFRRPAPSESYVEPAFAFLDLPQRYSPRGVRTDRTNPLVMRATSLVEVPAGKYRLLVRTRNSARFSMDGELVLETPFRSDSADAHHDVHLVESDIAPNIRPLQPGDMEQVTEIEITAGVHRFELEAFVGGRKRRPEIGEMSVSLMPILEKGESSDAIATQEFRILSPRDEFRIPLTNDGWHPFADARREALLATNTVRRRAAMANDGPYWNRRHEFARQQAEVVFGDVALPAAGQQDAATHPVDRFVAASLSAANAEPPPVCDDWTFLRRVSLDTIGMIPPPEIVQAFLADEEPGRRERLVGRLLDHPGWADHWVGYWQDVLAENPNIVNPTLNNTGPFRWWIHESFLDNKPIDRFVTELVMMEGSEYFGGPAGFAMATQNDAPMAEKANVLGQAFLGMQLKCARCHDAPFHDFLQSDLFSLAAMLGRGPQAVPATSSIPAESLGRSSLVEVTLKPGEKVGPAWPFPKIVAEEFPTDLLRDPEDPRERLAALITSPHNQRFARVVVNRLWHRYLGHGLVEPLDDWDGTKPTNPQLLDFLAREFITHDYDLKHVARLILTSQTYQREVSGNERVVPELPVRRRLAAEQIVDSLFTAAGKTLRSEELNIDVDSARPYTVSLNLGAARRGWNFTSMSNERDRPSLALPYAQSIIDVLESFGWRASRQSPLTVRDQDPSVLQPAVLSNGTMIRRVTALSDDSIFTALALKDQPVERLVADVFQQVLTRPPTAYETEVFTDLLKEGYESRRVPGAKPAPPPRLERSGVSWTNHLSEEANRIQIERERQVRDGDPPSPRLQSDWRERMEDMIWTLINTPEFIFVP